MLNADDKTDTQVEHHLRRRLFSFAELAAMLHVTVSCIRRWRYEGKIEVVKLGRLVRVSASEVDRLIAEGVRPQRDDP